MANTDDTTREEMHKAPADRVAEAVVAARPLGEDHRLIAYFVPRGGEAPGFPELRAFLAARLPDHMVPALFYRLDALPLSPNGKVDRRALPEPGSERPEMARPAQYRWQDNVPPGPVSRFDMNTLPLSPAAWPQRSLMCLKKSTSIMTAVNGAALRAARAHSRSASSKKLRRL